METITTGCAISSDRIKMRVERGILLASASGVLGLRECLGVQLRMRHAAQGQRAIVIDLRGAALTLSPGEYARYVQAALLDPIRLPVAFVVSDALMPLACAHELLFRRRGLVRRFFSSMPPALRWVSRLPRSAPGPDLFS